MKLTDFLQGVGRPIAYYPSLRRITGSTNATIFLCQLIYWKGKEADPEGWIYKTSEDMETETGLSYDEQKTARTKLKEAGLIEEHYARLDHQMKYRLNMEKIDASWGQPVPESRNAMFGNEASPFSLNSNTENTTENKPPSNLPIEWYIEAGKEIPPELIEKNRTEKTARDTFEQALGFGTLPYDSTKDWQKFGEWLAKIDPQTWEKYAEWRRGVGKYEAMSNKQIRQNPRAFIDTGYPAFMAHSAMNKNPEESYRKL